VTGPVASGPVTSGPAVTGPVTSGPAVTGPVTSGPVVTGPVTSGPAVTGAAARATRPPGAQTIDEILAAARARLHRLTPEEAFAGFSGGAVLVDIRPQAQRAREGGIPGAVIIERNVLEWRFDPASDARLPWVHGYDQEVIVFCSEGYTSSLAAAALQDLGLASATDIIGGFVAWAAGGLPTCPPESAGPAARAC
jgi:rhodanese-related sulfurtransferase